MAARYTCSPWAPIPKDEPKQITTYVTRGENQGEKAGRDREREREMERDRDREAGSRSIHGVSSCCWCEDKYSLTQAEDRAHANMG